MHIKQLSIRGFKSYSDTVVVDDFDVHHNVIVGRNGSGKSNFFNAICFVLCDDNYENLRKEDRIDFLHEGTGQRTQSAYVEVVFDNAGTSKRLPYDTNEVVLRRTIKAESDIFQVNGKVVKKMDVINMLEAAGFSRSNPYYIVKQGKINSLALMTNAQRLELLKEVAGTRVYEEKRRHSKKIFQSTINKRQKIQEVSVYIGERLEELKEEKEELGEFQKLDKTRRALEYVLYEQDRNVAKDLIDEIDKERSKESEGTSEVHTTVRDTQSQIVKLQTQLDTLISGTESKQKELVDKTHERSTLLKRRVELKFDEQELNQRIETEANRFITLSEELKSCEERIDNATKMLNDNAVPQYNQEMEQKHKLELELNACKEIVNNLHSKKDRAAQFSTANERDVFLNKQIQDLQIHIDTETNTIAAKKVEIETISNNVQQLEQTLDAKQKLLEQQKEEIVQLSRDMEKTRTNRNLQIEKRKTLWITEASFDERNAEWKEELEKNNKLLNSMMPPGVASGIETCIRLQTEHQSSWGRDIYGPLINLIRPTDTVYRKPLETVAGSSLFHVIVRDENVARKCMSTLVKERSGRVTFMPISRLNRDEPRYPPQPSDATDENASFIPIINCIQSANTGINPAINQIFGKTLIVHHLIGGSKFARKHNFDCVNMEGDQVLRGGIIKGGYQDSSRSAFNYQNKIMNAMQQLMGNAEATETCKKEIKQVDAAINASFQHMQNIDMKRAKLRKSVATLAHELGPLHQELLSLKDALKERQVSYDTIIQTQVSNQTKLQSMKDERGTPLADDLSDEEKETLARNKNRLDEVEKLLENGRAKINQVQNQRSALEALLSSNLLRRRVEIVALLASGGSEPFEEDLNKVMDELNHVIEHIAVVEKRLKDVSHGIAKAQKDENDLRNQLDQLGSRFVKDQASLDDALKNVEKMLNRRNLALQRRDHAMKKIRELGTLPPKEMIDSFGKLDRKEIEEKLQKTSEQLNKFSHINKKAMDQYVNFSERKEDLLKKKKEVDLGAESIKNLIKKLDMKKDEAIMRTFGGVQKHFSAVFSELVPSGKGSLILEKSDEEENDGNSNNNSDNSDDDGESQLESSVESQSQNDITLSSPGTPRVKSFIGVSVKVTFAGELESTQTSSLSGGQKTLVALALIFAIQRCDPAPFYLFDEIDQALDSTHRNAVASLIDRQSHSKERSAQFICSTFSPELVDVADRHFGVAHQHKVSTVKSFSHEDAMTFIKEIQRDTEVPVTSGLNGSSRMSASDLSSIASSTKSGKKRTRRDSSSP
jgi:structural maintenance of chromosome 3 (chondroitin sulfate proteoglycan 6)